ncbi:unnamed protein product [Larinioides sclopetarius]|uniref:Uncharacterized protein n=1 Tax=Larinioides sclopetarius TaxID=280406 RepID=A0AAV2B4I9_9ARAC
MNSPCRSLSISVVPKSEPLSTDASTEKRPLVRISDNWQSDLSLANSCSGQPGREKNNPAVQLFPDSRSATFTCTDAESAFACFFPVGLYIHRSFESFIQIFFGLPLKIVPAFPSTHKPHLLLTTARSRPLREVCVYESIFVSALAFTCVWNGNSPLGKQTILCFRVNGTENGSTPPSNVPSEKSFPLLLHNHQITIT